MSFCVFPEGDERYIHVRCQSFCSSFHEWKVKCCLTQWQGAIKIAVEYPFRNNRNSVKRITITASRNNQFRRFWNVLVVQKIEFVTVNSMWDEIFTTVHSHKITNFAKQGWLNCIGSFFGCLDAKLMQQKRLFFKPQESQCTCHWIWRTGCTTFLFKPNGRCVWMLKPRWNFLIWQWSTNRNLEKHSLLSTPFFPKFDWIRVKIFSNPIFGQKLFNVSWATSGDIPTLTKPLTFVRIVSNRDDLLSVEINWELLILTQIDNFSNITISVMFMPVLPWVNDWHARAIRWVSIIDVRNSEFCIMNWWHDSVHFINLSKPAIRNQPNFLIRI